MRQTPANQITQEELYEINRQTALRRTLHEKERELHTHHLQKNPRDRLRGNAAGIPGGPPLA